MVPPGRPLPSAGGAELDVDELRRREERYRLAVEASTDVVWDWDRATGRVVWSDELRRAFGWPPEAPGRTLEETLAWLFDRVHPADRGRARAAIEPAAAGQRDGWRAEYRLRRADGVYGVVLDRGRVVLDPEGQPRRVVGVLRDVTRRVRLEEEQRFLAEAGRVLASSLDYEQTLRAVARLAIPELADWCAVDLLDERGTPRVVAGAHADPARERRLHELQRRYPPTTADDRPVARVLRTGRALFVPTLPDAELEATSVDAEHARLRREVGFASLLVVPLLVGGRTLGAVTFACGPDRPPYRPEDLPIAEEVGRRAAVALEHARVHGEAQEQAQTHIALNQALREAADARQQGEERFRRLTRSLLAVGSSGGRDLDAVLDEVARQVCLLFDAQHAGVQLAVPGSDEFVRRRSSPLAVAAIPEMEAGRRFRPDALARAAIAEGRAVFAPDFHAEPRIDPLVRSVLPGVASSVAVPMVAEGEVVGFLFALWETRHEEAPGDAEAALLLAQHAAAVVRTARALEDSRRARAEAEAAVRQRDAFLGAAAHELKTPITSLRGFAQLLRRQVDRTGGADPAHVAQAMAEVDRQSHRLAALVDQLLDLTRLDEDRLELELQHLDLAELVARAADELRTAHPRHPLRVDAPGPVVVRADPGRVEQLLVSLVGNAARFAPVDSSIEVTLAAADGRAVLSVRDYGPGVPEAEREAIFDRYTRTAGSGHSGGFGIGLHLARRVAELHGGSLSFEPPPLGGACFVLRLPLAS